MMMVVVRMVVAMMVSVVERLCGGWNIKSTGDRDITSKKGGMKELDTR